MAGWHVYILRCGDGTLYTGATNDLPRRVARHALGRGARYTRSRLPVALVYARRARDRGAALSAEARLKQLSRGEKLALIEARPLARSLARAALGAPMGDAPERRVRRGRAGVPSSPREEKIVTTQKAAGKDALHDLKEIGRKLEDVGRKLASATGRTVKNAAEETLEVADEALAAARRNLRKVRGDMKKRP